MTTLPPIQLAMSNPFFTAFSKLSRTDQTKVEKLLREFRNNPTSQSLNYETLHNAANPNYRSIRLDGDIRVIVLKPEKGNVYVMMWVDRHDDAYAWAARNKTAVHPETGVMQIYTVEEAEPTSPPPEAKPEKEPGRFDQIRDRELIRAGIPEDLLEKVRSLKSDTDVEAAEDWLPREAAEALYLLGAGYSLEETLREMDYEKPSGSVDVEDVATALEKPHSQQTFTFVHGDKELEEMLNAPLEKWRIFLHPSQNKLKRINANGPVRVLGGAGTGKTVVAMHRAKWLAENVLQGDNEKILFTTFTLNLATDIRENLRSLCGVDLMRRIEVTHIDGWVRNFLSQNGYNYTIVFDERLEELWKLALAEAPAEPALHEEFYRAEWSDVIQAQGISDLAGYVRASRVGRGRSLSRSQRMAIWPVFEEYRALLQERRWKELTDATRDARLILEKKGRILPYRCVIIDEAQDMSAEMFRLARAMIPSEVAEQGNDLFIVGDAHQRIYGHKVVLGQCGVEIRGRGKRLRVNYRTTEETRRWAVALLEGRPFDDLDGDADTLKGYKSLMHGEEPKVQSCESFEEEVRAVLDVIKSLESGGQALADICVCARTNALVDTWKGALGAHGVSTHVIKRSSGDERKQPGIRLATMHRVKGLEFDCVLLVDVNEGVVPLEKALVKDNLHELEQSELRERSLLHVAATRAKKALWVFTSGKPSPFFLP